MKNSVLQCNVVSIFLAFCWAVGFWTIQPFDFDEAFYRRLAEEMLVSKNYFWTTYQFQMDTNKPTGYIWMLVGSHYLFDGFNSTHVSAAASRFVSLLFTYLTAWFTYFICLREFPATATRSRSEVFCWVMCAFSCMWLPTIGAGSVLIDPALTFFSIVAIYFLNRLVFDEYVSWPLRDAFICGFAMFVSCLLKGPIGVVLPALFLGFRILFLWATFEDPRVDFLKFKTVAFKVVSKSMTPFFIGGALLASYYTILWNIGAKEYVYDFLITHNFKRAVTAREGHSGQFFYYAVILLIGGAPLMGMWIADLKRRASFKSLLLNPWFSWMIAVLFFYTVVATKLPNYIWPVWPAIVLCFFGDQRFADQAKLNKLKAWKRLLLEFFKGLCCLVPVLLGVGFLVLPLIVSYIGFIPELDPRAFAVIQSLGDFPTFVKFCFATLGVLFFATAYFIYNYHGFSVQQLLRIALVGGLINLVIKAGVLPYADGVLNGSIIRLSGKASALNPELFAVVGMQTPTADSFYSGQRIENFGAKSETPYANSNVVVLTPIWNSERCRSHGLVEIERDYHMILCARTQIR